MISFESYGFAKLYYSRFKTDLGDMVASANDAGLYLLEFADRKEVTQEMNALAKQLKATVVEDQHHHLETIRKEVTEYMRGRKKTFTVPVQLSGTPFQEKVWNALLTISYGETHTYKQQSEILGDVKAIRAVATANGDNKLAIIVPCHRIIGSDGSMTGYAGGIKRKKTLLELEKKNTGKPYQVEMSF